MDSDGLPARLAVRSSAHMERCPRQHGRLLSDRRVVQLGHGVPVDHVVKRGDVVGTAILVVQVVGVLPDVDAQNRRVARA